MSVLSTFSGPNRSHGFQHFSVLRPTSHADSSRLLPAFAFPVTVQSVFAIFFIFKCCPLNLLCFFLFSLSDVSLFPYILVEGDRACSHAASEPPSQLNHCSPSQAHAALLRTELIVCK